MKQSHTDSFIEVMDTTLRDGEQCPGVDYSSEAKLQIAELLLTRVRVDRIEIASAGSAKREFETCTEIMRWAKKNGFNDRIEVLSRVDKKSVDWIYETGCRVMNLLAKGSERHCRRQLKMTPDNHLKEIGHIVRYAHKRGIAVNVYLEDWSRGMAQSKRYVYQMVECLTKLPVRRLMICDTVGVLDFDQTRTFVEEILLQWDRHIDFHGHNDYGFGGANTLAAVKAGVHGIHVTVNGLGERVGNASQAEVVAAIHDFSRCVTHIDELQLRAASRVVSALSGKDIAENAPVVGRDAFVNTAGIHADGNLKGGLYESSLKPERFGAKASYALGKLCGKGSIIQILRNLGFHLTRKRIMEVKAHVDKIVERGHPVTEADIPFIVREILGKQEYVKFELIDVTTQSRMGGSGHARAVIRYKGKLHTIDYSGTGGFDAFISGVREWAKGEGEKIEIPAVIDYKPVIPPGGKSDAIVVTNITWRTSKGEEFKTYGLDPDQVIAGIIAVVKAVNLTNNTL